MTTERELRQRGLDPVVLVDSNGNAASSTAGTLGAVTIDQTASAPKGSASFTPAASSHATPAVNGGAQQFTWTDTPVTGKSLIITGAELEIDGSAAEATAWRLYLYSVTPPSALTDTTTFDVPSGDRASYLGYIDLGTAVDLGATQWIETQGINKQIKLATTELWGYLVNLTTLTPAAVAHKVTLQTLAV